MNNFDVQDQKIVSDKIKNDSHTIVYDPSSGEIPDVLPNTDEILDNVIKILECMNTDEMQLLKTANAPLFEQTMEEKFQAFADRYYSIFRMVLSGDDITPLFKMLSVINGISSGNKSFEDGEREVGSYLTKFLPSDLIDKIATGEVTENDVKYGKKNKKKKH